MLLYHILEPACNTVETGSQYPQVQEMAPDYNYKAPNSVHALSKAVDKFPDFIPNLDYFVVHEKAKITDLLSVAPVSGGFLISQRFKILLEKFNLASHKFYPANIYHRKQFHKYYWMHIICDLTDLVDYSNSIFFSYYNYKHNLGYVNVASKEDFQQKKEKIKKDNPGKTVTIWAEKIKLKADFDRTLHLFEIGGFDSNFYISQQLKEAIDAAKITGCDISPAANLSL